MATQNASYTKTQQCDSFVFHVTPAPKVLGGCAGLFFAGNMAVLISMATGGEKVAGNKLPIVFGRVPLTVDFPLPEP